MYYYFVYRNIKGVEPTERGEFWVWLRNILCGLVKFLAMESKRLCALIVLIVTTGSAVKAIDSIDVLNHITRWSPALPEKNGDLFGFSFAVHQMFSDPSVLTGDEALNQTV